MKRVTAVLATCLLMVYAFITPLNAQTASGFNLSASPLPINLSAKPGETVSTELRIKNNGTETEELTVSLFKFSAAESGQVKLSERTSGDDYFDWVTFSSKTLSAKPGQWASVNMTITLPEEAAFGYYYAVSFSKAGEPQSVDGGAALKGQLVVFVLLEAVVPNAVRKLNIVSFTADRKSYEFLPAGFSLDVRNTGNVHVVPRGNIFISRGGKQVATLNVNESLGNILPDSKRGFKNQWDDGFPVYIDKTIDGKVVNDDKGQPVKQLKWDFSKIQRLRFGKYTAKLLLVYNDGQRDIPVTAEVSFWVVPWRIIGVGSLTIVLAGIGLWTTSKGVWRKVKKTDRKQNETTTD